MTKKLLIILIAIFGITTIKAQQASVERSISGVQVGIPTFRFYYETRLSESSTLRAEAGLGSLFLVGPWGGGLVMFPEFSVQPRWYYNLNRRNQRGRNISNNAADFLTINTIIFIASGGGLGDSGILFIPTWGMRRNLGRYFEYELGVGVGYAFGFNGGSGVIYRPHFRIGHRF